MKLGDFREQDARFEHLAVRTTAFIVLALVLVVGFVASVMVRQGVFTQTSRLYFFADSAAGIFKGMSVQLSGFKIGSVQDLDLEPDTRVKVQLSVKTEYMRHIAQDARARLAKEGLIGASFIEVVTRSGSARTLPNNGVLKFERAQDFSHIAEALAGKLHPILDDLKQLTGTLNDPEGDIRQTVRNLRVATGMVADMREQLLRVTQAAEERVGSVSGKVEQVLDRTAATLDKAGGTVDKVGGTLDKASATVDTAGAAISTLNGTLSQLDRQLPQILFQLDATLKNVEGISVEARRLSTRLASELPPIMQDGRALMEDTREVMDGARSAWPIRNFVPAPKQNPLLLDSHDGLPATR